MAIVWVRLNEDDDDGKAFAKSCLPCISKLFMILLLPCAANITIIIITAITAIVDIIKKAANNPYHL